MTRGAGLLLLWATGLWRRAGSSKQLSLLLLLLLFNADLVDTTPDILLFHICHMRTGCSSTCCPSSTVAPCCRCCCSCLCQYRCLCDQFRRLLRLRELHF
jgi:hypothetical protein